MPRLASTGPAVKTRNSTRTAGPGPTRRQPAAAAWGPRACDLADRLARPAATSSRLRCRWRSCQRPVPIDDALDCICLTASSDGRSPFDGLLDEARRSTAATCSQVGTAGGASARLELLAEDLQLRVVGELAGVPGGLDGRQVADARRRSPAGSRARSATGRTSRRRRGCRSPRRRRGRRRRRTTCPGRTSLPGSGATAYLSVRQAGVLDQADVPRAGDERAVACRRRSRSRARPGRAARVSARALVEVRRVVVERLGHLRGVDGVLGAVLVGERGAVGPGERQHASATSRSGRAGG